MARVGSGLSVALLPALGLGGCWLDVWGFVPWRRWLGWARDWLGCVLGVTRYLQEQVALRGWCLPREQGPKGVNVINYREQK